MKKVGVIQSNYIPWKGYFDIINDVDLFVFHDDLQYTKNDWRNRNKIKTVQGPSWLTVPVGDREDRLICEVEVRDDSWRTKHWARIKQSYSRMPYFRQFSDFFENIYLGSSWRNLSELNQYLIKTISKEFLGIKAEFRDSREFHPVGEKLDRLLDLLSKVGATTYISGPSAKAYIDNDRFVDAGIELIYKDYSGYPEYPQPYPPFEHAVSIVDVLFNCGPQAAFYIWGWRDASPEHQVEVNEVAAS